MNKKIVLTIDSLSKSYINKNKTIQAIKKINLKVNKGEFISIFGPNGCGKTTLLNLIAGIDHPTDGSILLINSGDNHNRIGFVFQDYDKSLMPWKKCLDNIYFPLEKNQNLNQKEKIEKAVSIIDLLGIKNRLPLNSYPYQMSGGEKQLTCIARALITDPDVLLFDEPFASLDFQTRLEMIGIVENIWLKTQKTILFISHDIEEAIHLADRLILLSPRPTSIRNEYKISFNRPRSFEIDTNQDFTKLKKMILNEFTEMVKK